MLRKIIRKLKRYDLYYMEELKRLTLNIKDQINLFEKSKGVDAPGGLQLLEAQAVAFDMARLEDNYPLETYVAVYSIYENELKEIYEHIQKYGHH